MSGTYPVSIIDEWRTMRDAYDLDQTKPNPYEEVDSRTPVFLHGFLPPPNLLPDVTMAELRMELAKALVVSRVLRQIYDNGDHP
jgi:hypothetical protein